VKNFKKKLKNLQLLTPIEYGSSNLNESDIQLLNNNIKRSDGNKDSIKTDSALENFKLNEDNIHVPTKESEEDDFGVIEFYHQ